MSKNLVVVGDDNDETDGRKWEKAGRNSSIVVLEARCFFLTCEIPFAALRGHAGLLSDRPCASFRDHCSNF
jgi:hypothetical protein